MESQIWVKGDNYECSSISTLGIRVMWHSIEFEDQFICLSQKYLSETNIFPSLQLIEQTRKTNTPDNLFMYMI